MRAAAVRLFDVSEPCSCCFTHRRVPRAAVLQRRKLELKAMFERNCSCHSFKRLDPGGFIVDFIGSTYTTRPCSRAHLSISRCGPAAACLWTIMLSLPCSCAHRVISMPPPKRAPAQVLTSQGHPCAGAYTRPCIGSM